MPHSAGPWCRDNGRHRRGVAHRVRLGVVIEVKRVGGEQVAILGVKNEHQAQQRCYQASINVVRIARHRIAQQIAMSLVVSRLKTSQQIVKRFEHLASELGGNNVLELAAVGENGRKALFLGHAVKPLERQQHAKRGHDRPARHLDHIRQFEGDVAARFTARRTDQTDLAPVHKQPGGRASLAQEPFKPNLGTGLPPARIRNSHRIQIGPGGKHVHEQDPFALRIFGLEFPQCVGRAERFVVFRQGRFKRIRNGRRPRRSV